MNYFFLTIFAPTQAIFKDRIRQLSLPGLEGEMTLLSDHMPIISALAAGQVTVWIDEANEPQNIFDISGGFVNMKGNECTIFVCDQDDVQT